MSVVTVDPLSLELHHSNTVILSHVNAYVDGERRTDVQTLLVTGNGIADLDLLVDEVSAGILRYAKAKEPEMNADIKAEKIEELRAENDRQSPLLSYSRGCHICLSAHPRGRVALVPCGHIICYACALQIETHCHLTCPFCRMSSTFVQLREDVVEEKEERTGAEKKQEKKEKPLLFPFIACCLSVAYSSAILCCAEYFEIPFPTDLALY